MNLDEITAILMTAAAFVMLIGLFVHGNWLATAFAFTGMAFAWRCVK